MAVKWGVIGAGGIADRRTIREGIMPAANAELVAVQDVAEDRVKEVAAKYDVSAVYTSEYDLLSDSNVEAVYIATPTHLHYSQVMAAAEAGKHVLCEKPLALTLAQCEEMVEECAARNVKLGVNFMMRFHSCHTALKQMIDEGKLGDLVMGRAELTCWYPPIPGAFRQDPAMGGGGSFIDMGNHCVDLLEQFFGRTVEVMCYTSNIVQDYASEDTAVAMLKFANGAVGVVDAMFNVPDAAARNALEVYGSQGSVYSFGTIGQGSEGALNVVLEDAGKAYDAGQARSADEGKATITPSVINIYQAHIEAFSDAVIHDTQPPIPGEEGIWSHKVIDACYESARTGRAVQVD